ncbi:MAG: Holliday junction resolvase RuvX [bacterium]|nr:Holliday junction resolvase RuvX [bacterium]
MPACLGLDYGLRRIGIAAGDTERRLAFTVKTHTEGEDGSILRTLADLIAARDVGIIVIGLPLTADGRVEKMAEQAQRFADRLRREFDADVVMWDERYSSAEADRWLADAKKTVKGDRDAVAAAIILQSWLDSLPDEEPETAPAEKHAEESVEEPADESADEPTDDAGEQDGDGS